MTAKWPFGDTAFFAAEGNETGAAVRDSDAADSATAITRVQTKDTRYVLIPWMLPQFVSRGS
jgi:hypothetical protein